MASREIPKPDFCFILPKKDEGMNLWVEISDFVWWLGWKLMTQGIQSEMKDSLWMFRDEYLYIYRWVFSTKTTWVLMFQVFQLPQKFWHPIFFGKPIDSTWRSNRPGKSEQEVIELKQMAKEEEEERERIRLEKLKQDWRTVQVHDHQRSEFFFFKVNLFVHQPDLSFLNQCVCSVASTVSVAVI